MTRPRFTVLRLMILVALMGTASGLYAWMARRAAAFQAQAAVHAGRAWEVSLACRINSKLLFHHEDLAHKYKRAARCPWLPVAPDPPEPD